VKKSEFITKFWRVVTRIQREGPVVYNRYWGLAVKYAHEEGLGISANDSVDENKLLRNLIDVSMMSVVVSTSPDILSIMASVEQAWEYYQKKQEELANSGGDGG
jgi:hypothetical protein